MRLVGERIKGRMSQQEDPRVPSSTLTDKLKEGDDAAATLLFQRFGPWLQKAVDRKIGARLRRRVDTDDIMQSAFWSFFRRTSDGQYAFEHSGALCRMLLKIAENKIRKAADYHHRQRRDVDRELAADAAELQISDRQWQDAALQLADSIDEIAGIIDELEPRDAEFFRLKHFQGHSIGKIAAETGWSVATVKRVLNRVTQRVRQRVESRISS